MKSHQPEDVYPEVCQTWVGQGVRLEIVAMRLRERQWTLSIVNERGIIWTWNEFFTSADVAIAVARDAIEDEGVEAFVSTEGFEYLDDLPDPILIN